MQFTTQNQAIKIILSPNTITFSPTNILPTPGSNPSHYTPVLIKIPHRNHKQLIQVCLNFKLAVQPPPNRAKPKILTSPTHVTPKLCPNQRSKSQEL